MPKSKTRKRRAQLRATAHRQPAKSPVSTTAARNTRFTRLNLGTDYRRRRGDTAAEKFDAWLTRTWTGRRTTIALVLAICATAALAIALLVNEHKQDLFDNAPYCLSATETNCEQVLTAAIQDKGGTGGVGSKPPPIYYLDLTGPQPADGRFDLPEESALWDSAESGDTVTAYVWNGAVVRILDGSAAGDTDNAPVVGITLNAALLASAGVCSLAFAVLLIRIVHVGRGDKDGWSRKLVPFNPIALAAVFLFPIGTMAGSQFESIPISLLCGAGFTSIAAIYILVNWLRTR